MTGLHKRGYGITIENAYHFLLVVESAVFGFRLEKKFWIAGDRLLVTP